MVATAIAARTSRLRIGRGTNQATAPRAGKRTPPKSKEAKGKQMWAAGHSYGEIANTLGISKSYAYKLAIGKRGYRAGEEPA